MGTSLFKDSEVFMKQRPEEITKEQEDQIWEDLAQEVIDNKWSKNDIEDIVDDLQDLSKSDSGYEMAKYLEDWGGAVYDIKTSFIEWLDNLDYKFYQAKRDNVREWVKAHDVKPKIQIGTQFTVKEFISRWPELKVGKVIFINGLDERQAQYLVSNDKDSPENILVNYEIIEKGCVAYGEVSQK